MATKVFISWSGELSRKLAEAVRNWLPSTLQFVKPYFTPEDIEKGAKWSSEISKELETSNIGIVCLTRENTEKPWILFEAGALSKSLQKSHVCTLLFDLDPADVKGPLTSFQGTRFLREDFKKLVITINSAAGDSKLEPGVLEAVFEMWWPKLEQQVAQILANHEEAPKTAKRSERDILEELLELTRLSASRAVRPVRISSRAFSELLEAIEQLLLLCDRDNLDALNGAFRRLERPLRLLSADTGFSEGHERLRMWREFFIGERKRVSEEVASEPTKVAGG